MSNQPTQILYGSGEPMELESSTYTCPHCHADILQSNQDTHEARCARMNRDQPQVPAQSSTKQQQENLGRQEQRGTNGLRITKEHSSSSIPYPEEPTNQMRQPQVRREARRVAENKLMTCANCDKSVREDDLATHQRYECQGSDKIPCEFCDKQVSMTDYQNHIDHCPKRQEEAQQERARSLERQRQEEEEMRQYDTNQRRVNSAERRPPSNVNAQPQRQEQQQQQQGQGQGQQEGHGFMNFLKNLATVALQNRPDVEDSTQPQTQQQSQSQNQNQQRPQRQQEQQQRQSQEAQGQQPSFLARLLGFHPETPEQAEQRRQQRAAQQEREQERRRAEMQRRQREVEMLQNLFEPRQSRQNRQQSMMEDMMMGGSQPQGHVRTIRFGPHGSVIISSSNRGSEQVPPTGYQPRQRQFMEHEMEEMGPLGVLLSMMNGGVPGMRVISPEELEGMSQEQQAGLAREVMDSLSVINYDTEKNKNVSEDLKSCPICIEDFTDGDEVRYLWCMHRFHKGCVDKWLEQHSNCPICKKEYSESEVSFE